MKLYQKIKIPNFDQMQKELQGLVHGVFPNKLLLTYYDPSLTELAEKCPTLIKYLFQNIKRPLRFFRIYHSPAGGGLGMHIDGGATNRSPIGLNLPILNCKNSHMKWWDESNAKIINGNFGYGNKPACKILNPSELACIGSTEIEVPAFVRTDIIHSVENYNTEPRIIMSIRWDFNDEIGQQFEDVMNFEPYDVI